MGQSASKPRKGKVQRLAERRTPKRVEKGELFVKACSKCKRLVPRKRFSSNTTNRDGLQNYCKECMRKVKRHLRYGISPEVYNQLFVDQGGKCYICGKHEDELVKVLHVDHNHKTGDIRKLLCFHCNAGLGHFCDRPELIERALNYLKEHE